MVENKSIENEINIFLASLAKNNREYELVERESDFCVRIRFPGLLMGKQVVWNAKIQTLQDKLRRNLKQINASVEAHSLKQSIKISETDQGYSIEIALNLTQIDVAAIKRTIIMIRKYKRLHPGLHEFGEAIMYKPD